MAQITSKAISTMLSLCKGTRSKFIVEAYNPKTKKQFLKIQISDGVDSVRAVIHVQNQKLDLCKVGKPYGDQPKYLIQITDFAKFQQENIVILEIKNFIPLDPPKVKSQQQSILKSHAQGIVKIEGGKSIKTSKKEIDGKDTAQENSSEIEVTFEQEEKNLQCYSFQQLKKFQKIADLYQNFSGWEIVVRVVQKTYKQFINRTGKLTKILQMTLIDRTKNKIEGVMFGDDAKEIYQTIKQNRVYRMSRGTVRQDSFHKNKEGKFSRFNIVFSKFSKFIQIANNESIPEGNCELTSLEDAANQRNMQKLYNVPVILLSIGEERNINKEDTTLVKKNITVGDPQSRKSIQVTLWNRDGKQINPDHLIHQAILLKKFKLNMFKDSLYLNSTFKSEIIPLPDHSFNQCENSLKQSNYLSLTGEVANQYRSKQETKTIQQLQQEINRHDFNNGDIFSSLKVFVTHINLIGKFCYDACCNPKCMKAAEAASKCIHCGQYNNTIKHKFNARIQVSDWTGSLSLTAFDDFALQIFKGLTADQLIRMEDDEQSEAVQKRLYQPFSIKLLTKKDLQRGFKHSVVGKVREVEVVKTSIQNVSKIRELYD